MLISIDDPARIEDFVAAVLRIRLRKHHEFSVGRIAIQIDVTGNKVVDFVVAQRQAELGIRGKQRIAAIRSKRNPDHRRRFAHLEKRLRLHAIGNHSLSHAIEKHWRQCHHVGVINFDRKFQRVANAALDTVDSINIAGLGNIRRLR